MRGWPPLDQLTVVGEDIYGATSSAFGAQVYRWYKSRSLCDVLPLDGKLSRCLLSQGGAAVLAFPGLLTATPVALRLPNMERIEWLDQRLGSDVLDLAFSEDQRIAIVRGASHGKSYWATVTSGGGFGHQVQRVTGIALSGDGSRGAVIAAGESSQEFGIGPDGSLRDSLLHGPANDIAFGFDGKSVVVGYPSGWIVVSRRQFLGPTFCARLPGPVGLVAMDRLGRRVAATSGSLAFYVDLPLLTDAKVGASFPARSALPPDVY